nr:50S ribosome-binding GTPase [Anaerolineae bacterium]
MPTNLPPEYFHVEKLYKAAQTPEEKATLLEEMLGTIPKHKGTDKLRADLRRRLSKLKAATEERKKSGKGYSPYHIDKEGAGQVALIGPPNVGKSSLVAALTNAEPDIADYPFTTQAPMPGMMEIDNIQVQLIDTPPVTAEFADPQLMNLLRRVDLVLLLVDIQADPITQVEETLAVLEKHRILPIERQADYPDPSRLYFVPILILVNKTDDDQRDEDYQALCELVGGEICSLIPISAATGRHVEAFKQIIFDQLEVVRIYSKPPGKDPDYTAPFVMKRGSTVEEFASKVHRDFFDQLKSARVWGSGVFDGQMVGRDHVLQDGDLVELRT